MASKPDRLRPPPSTRLAEPEMLLDLRGTLRALRAESHPAIDGHRQIGLLHRGSLRMVAFAFDAGGYLGEHRAPGVVLIQVLTGSLRVKTPGATHELGAGEALVLDPEIPHRVEAAVASDMLLMVCLESPREMASEPDQA